MGGFGRGLTHAEYKEVTLTFVKMGYVLRGFLPSLLENHGEGASSERRSRGHWKCK